MKIAIIVDQFPCRSETFILSQITGLIKRGHDVEVYANSGGNNLGVNGGLERYDLGKRTIYFQHGNLGMPANKLLRLVRACHLLRESCQKGKLEVIRSLNIVRFGRSAASLELLYKGVAFVRNGSYDIVHCHFGPNGKVAAALKDVGAIKGKVITSFYGYDISSYIKKNGPNVFDFLFFHGDLFIVISEKMRDDLIRLGCSRDKIVVHRLGVDLSQFKFSPRKTLTGNKIRLLTVGRFVEKKGIEYGIRAVEQVVKKYPEIEYKIVGDGELKEEISKLITCLNLGKSVQLLGWQGRKEVAKLLEVADIFLAPSVTARNGDQEGTPTVLIEALASGLPVLSTFHSGISELVQDGKSGFLVREKNSAALAEKLEYLIAHPEKWEAMGRAGREWIEKNYDINKLNDQLSRLFESLLDGNLERGTLAPRVICPVFQR